MVALFEKRSMTMDLKTNINIDTSGLLNTLISSLVVNAWYSAQLVYLKEHGSMSDPEKEDLLKEVSRQIDIIQGWFNHADTEKASEQNQG